MSTILAIIGLLVVAKIAFVILFPVTAISKRCKELPDMLAASESPVEWPY